MGDFYYELGVQIVEICIQTRPINGGFIDMDTLITILKRKRGSLAAQISANDVEKSVSKLQILGSGFQLKLVGAHYLVQSVPIELSADHSKIIELCEVLP